MKRKFMLCNICGNLIEMINDSGVTPVCCDEDMHEIIPMNEEERGEKHIPVVKQDGLNVKVEIGEIKHPMESFHHIKWIYIETNKRMIRFDLDITNDPECEFKLNENEIIKNVYSYCNIHSLWVKRLNSVDNN